QGLVDQVGAVIKWLDGHAGRQALLELLDLLLDSVDDLAAVLADQHHHQPGDDLALAVAGRQAGPDHRGGNDPGHIPDGDRHAVALVDDDRGDVLDVARLAHSPDVARLPIVDEIAAADVGVVGFQGV